MPSFTSRSSSTDDLGGVDLASERNSIDPSDGSNHSHNVEDDASIDDDGRHNGVAPHRPQDHPQQQQAQQQHQQQHPPQQPPPPPPAVPRYVDMVISQYETASSTSGDGNQNSDGPSSDGNGGIGGGGDIGGGESGRRDDNNSASGTNQGDDEDEESATTTNVSNNVVEEELTIQEDLPNTTPARQHPVQIEFDDEVETEPIQEPGDVTTKQAPSGNAMSASTTCRLPGCSRWQSKGCCQDILLTSKHHFVQVVPMGKRQKGHGEPRENNDRQQS